MSNPVDNIMKICLDGRLSGEALVEALEEQIAQIMPYKHSEEAPMEACNIPGDRMQVEIKGMGTISEIVERFEKTLTKRKLAFAFVHQAIEEKFGGHSHRDGDERDLDDFLGSMFGGKKRSRGVRGEIPQELIELLKAAKGQQSEDGSDCDAEDLSECWKCKKRTGCKRFNAN